MRHTSWHVDLEVDARDEMLLIARLATSGVATRAGVDYEGVEECKTAVNEACYYLININCRRLVLHYERLRDRIRICVTGKDDISSGQDMGMAAPAQTQLNNLQDELCVLTEILRELADRVEIHGTSIELERMI